MANSTVIGVSGVLVLNVGYTSNGLTKTGNMSVAALNPDTYDEAKLRALLTVLKKVTEYPVSYALVTQKTRLTGV